jgi:diguanylate cyclase (GGDEF)-like protein
VQFRHRLVDLLRPGGATEGVAILFIDLDRFKAVNDTLGHPVGDELLRAAAKRLCHCVRQMDMVARLGGDEFAIIQSGAVQPPAARALADRLVREFAEPFEVGGHQVLVGASVGIALSPQDGSEPDELLRNADLALYEAKAGGRGGHRFFRSQMTDHAQGRRELETDLRDALAQEQFELHYQPIVDLASRRVVAFEALLHWHHPDRGLVGSESFLTIAEKSGAIDAIGAWALNAAIRQAASWPDTMAIAVNLSPVQLRGGRLPALVAEALRESGLPADRLELEIAESMRWTEDASHQALLQQLRALGVGIVLDDFGVGSSSLSALRSFRFKRIKIHRSLVHDVVDDREAAAVVQAIATLGGSLGMAITASGVERQVQLDRLRTLGCGEAQGQFLGRPLPAAELSFDRA